MSQPSALFVWKVVAVLALAASIVGCAWGPGAGRGPKGEPDAIHDPDPARGDTDRELPSPNFLAIRALIVDLNPSGGTMTVKDDRSYGTWTIAVTEETRILGNEGALLSLNDLRVGEKVQIRGYSRIEDVMTALEVEQEPESP